MDDRARELARELADWATACKGNQEHFEAICARKISAYGDERYHEGVRDGATRVANEVIARHALIKESKPATLSNNNTE